jgi:rubrerythrin
VGFLNRLFSRASTLTTPASDVEATLYTGNETLEVVGESRHQDVLWRIVGGQRTDRVRHETHAVLMPEPDNPVDPNAIQVLVAGNPVGYLSRNNAVAYRPGLIRLMDDSVNGLVALNATIVGGGQRPDGVGQLGVFLDHDPSDFGIKPERAGDTAGFRTGLSEAIASDLEDDGYDLSWYRELSDNDITAIKQLRAMLETDPDPIDRHYMMSELEKRLYKSRDAFSSALDEFDAVCRQHDAEMVTIRPALFEKFGRIPLIDTYRQAAVRCQKVRDWATMRDWAERGIGVYGEHAARREDVEDLHKRLGFATAKIEAANKPKQRKPAKAVLVSATTIAESGEIEILVCAECGATFERVRTRGRKPHMCPTCRGV